MANNSIYDRHITLTETGATIPNAIVSVIKKGGGQAALFYDRAGANPAPNPYTADAAGRVQFYLQPALYDMQASHLGGVIDYPDVLINSDEIEIAEGFSVLPTAIDLLGSPDYIDSPAGSVVEVVGYSSKGDGGAAQWRKTGVTELTPSQSPSQLASAKLTDANGHEWEYVPDKGVVIAKAMGAAGNNTGDDQPAMQAGINSGLGPLWLTKGAYNVASQLDLYNDGDSVLGVGYGLVSIVPTFGIGDVIRVGDGATVVKNAVVAQLTIDAPSGVPRTSGAGLRVSNAERCNFGMVQLLDQFRGLTIDGDNTTHVVFNDIIIRNVVPSTGIGVFINGGGDHFFNNLSINNPSGSQPNAGITIQNSNATWIDNSDVIHSGIGLNVAPSAGDIVTWLFVTNSAFDLNDNDGIRIKSGDATAINKGHEFTACWTSSNGGVGVRVGGADVPDGVAFNNHRSVNNDNNGYLTESGINVTFDACKAAGNSQATPGTSAGFQFNAGVSKFAVRNCKSGTSMRFTTQQGRGILVAAGASDDYIVTSNDFTGNVAGPSDGGTGLNKVFTNNIS